MFITEGQTRPGAINNVGDHRESKELFTKIVTMEEQNETGQQQPCLQKFKLKHKKNGITNGR